MGGWSIFGQPRKREKRMDNYYHPEPAPGGTKGLVLSQQIAEKGCRELPAGGLGPVLSLPKEYPPASILPQEWGIEGVDEDFFGTLRRGSTLARCV